MTYSDLENRLPDEALIAVRNTIVLHLDRRHRGRHRAGVAARDNAGDRGAVRDLLFCIGAFRSTSPSRARICRVRGGGARSSRFHHPDRRHHRARPARTVPGHARRVHRCGLDLPDLGEIFSASDPYAPKWLLIVSGVVSVIAGIVMIAFSGRPGHPGLGVGDHADRHEHRQSVHAAQAGTGCRGSIGSARIPDCGEYPGKLAVGGLSWRSGRSRRPSRSRSGRRHC